MKTDITTNEHIEEMVKSFYQKIFADDLLGPVFKDIAGVDLEQHLPVMYKFWGMLLLGQKDYKGDPFEPHRDLNSKVPLDQQLFDRWLSLFSQTVDQMYEGPTAERAKMMAESIADGFLMRFGRIPF